MVGILQDSKEDWLKESVVMGEIYRNAILNIAATAASGGEQGLDFTRDAFSSKHLRVDATWNLSARTLEKPLLAPGQYYLVESSLWIREVDRAPLNSRGWVLQERLLSPRVLHFGRNQLFWQCGIDAFCEMFPKDLDQRLGVGPRGFTDNDLRAFGQVLQSIKDSPSTRLDPIAMEEAYTMWQSLVSTYTLLNLTKGEDKLIAIQALAETMQDAVQDRYIAGIWESQLAEDLLWRVATVMGNAKFSRPSQWRAPTWSWASLVGPVQKATLSGRYAGRKQFDGASLVQRIEPDVEGYQGLITGQLKRASLTIRGRLYRSKRPLQGQWVVQQQTGGTSHLNVNMGDEIRVVLNAWPDECDWNVNPSSGYQFDLSMLYFPMGTYKLTLNERETTHFEGLILVPTDSKMSFRRFGYFSLACSLGDVGDVLEAPVEFDDCRMSGENSDLLDNAVYQFTLL